VDPAAFAATSPNHTAIDAALVRGREYHQPTKALPDETDYSTRPKVSRTLGIRCLSVIH